MQSTLRRMKWVDIQQGDCKQRLHPDRQACMWFANIPHNLRGLRHWSSEEGVAKPFHWGWGARGSERQVVSSTNIR